MSAIPLLALPKHAHPAENRVGFIVPSTHMTRRDSLSTLMIRYTDTTVTSLPVCDEFSAKRCWSTWVNRFNAKSHGAVYQCDEATSGCVSGVSRVRT